MQLSNQLKMKASWAPAKSRYFRSSSDSWKMHTHFHIYLLLVISYIAGQFAIRNALIHINLWLHSSNFFFQTAGIRLKHFKGKKKNLNPNNRQKWTTSILCCHVLHLDCSVAMESACSNKKLLVNYYILCQSRF